VAATFCVFNISSQCFLNLGVKVADTSLARLRGLLGKVRLRSDEGLWMVPSRGLHTIGLMFPIDVIYLDSNFCIVHLIENLGPFRISPFYLQSESVLELPVRTIYESGSRIGDQLMICPQADMEAYFASQPPSVSLKR
jgi:uncharacterized membrane protein (UPF0127 family)